MVSDLVACHRVLISMAFHSFCKLEAYFGATNPKSEMLVERRQELVERTCIRSSKYKGFRSATPAGLIRLAFSEPCMSGG